METNMNNPNAIIKPKAAKQLAIPDTGFIRLNQIIGDPATVPPTPALIPVSATVWWEGIKSGRYPKGIKLSARTTAWRVEDIKALIQTLSEAA